MALVCTERYGSGILTKYMTCDDGTVLCERPRPASSYHPLRDCFMSLFLPHGFPDSVSEDYLEYQLWDTLQAFSSSVTGSLATHALLRGSGVGDSTASVTAATITWILRDGTGMVGRILFAWMKGSRLDCDAKRWRLFADVLNDLAIFMEILAPVFPSWFTLTVCTAGVFKCIVGVAGGATRAALTVHQARRDNMADVCAKDGSQETLVNLAGLLVSLVLVPVVSDSLWATYLLFLFLTGFHLYANYRAVHSVVMETLNQSRLIIVLEHFLLEGRILSPAEANPKEPLLPGLGSQVSVDVGAPLNAVVSSVSQLELLKEGNDSLYLLGWRRDTGRLAVVLHDRAGSVDVIRSVVHAEILHRKVSCSGFFWMMCKATGHSGSGVKRSRRWLSVPRLSIKRRFGQLRPPFLPFRSWQILKPLARAGLHPTTRVSWAVYTRAPTRLLSRLWGLLNAVSLPRWLRRPLLSMYVWAFSVNMQEAEVEDLNRYRNLGELFRRPLKPTARTISPQYLVSPCDGRVLHCGRTRGSQIEQVKGLTYSLENFLGPQDWWESENSGLPFLQQLGISPANRLYHHVVYLAPGDYHRFHSPADWSIQHRRHFPGSLLSVSPHVARWVPGLFCQNERVVLSGQWKFGFFSMTAVGATNVGSICIYGDSELRTNHSHHKKGNHHDCNYIEQHGPAGLVLGKGDPLGEFNFGSTIVLVFEGPRDYKFHIKDGERIFMGEALGTL